MMTLLIDFSGMGGNQFWEYNGEIYRDNYCMTYDAHDLTTKHCRKTDKQVSLLTGACNVVGIVRMLVISTNSRMHPFSQKTLAIWIIFF
jgi:hypothetical protein